MYVPTEVIEFMVVWFIQELAVERPLVELCDFSVTAHESHIEGFTACVVTHLIKVTYCTYNTKKNVSILCNTET